MAKKETENKSLTLEDFISSLDKTFGKGAVYKVGDAPAIEIERISSGSMLLDHALGGGYPRGRVIEIFGGESAGKSSLCLMAIAEAQKKGGRAGFIDMEHALDLSYAKKLGVDIDELVLTQPNDGDDAMEIANQMIKSGLFAIVVVDSVATLVPKSELEQEMGDSAMGSQARLMSKSLRMIAPIAGATKTTLMFTNQTRSKIGIVYGSPFTTSGGNALKYYASQRLDISKKGQPLKNQEGEAIGHELTIKVIKNKVSAPYKVAELKLYYGVGVSKIEEIVELLISTGGIKKAGSWYSYKETRLGQGMQGVMDTLADNPDLIEDMKLEVDKLMKKED